MLMPEEEKRKVKKEGKRRLAGTLRLTIFWRLDEYFFDIRR
jgi:hypothetical protein